MTPAPSRTITLAWTALSLAAGGWYFVWLFDSGHIGVPLLFVALVAADLFNGFHAVTFWITCLRRPRRRPFEMPSDAKVDVFIPTYNEPVDVLRDTVRAAVAMRGADVTVYVLDDGDRSEVRALSITAGARYIARPEHTGAKSGNVNHALALTESGGGEFICLFDADHVPKPEFLERTLGYFTDPELGLVQTPQVYGNVDAGPLTSASAEQQAIFFGPICAGKDGMDSAFCCGTNFAVRRHALQEAGGFPEDSITEDIVLSTRMIGLGYQLSYVPEELSVGLGPEDTRSYLTQQTRWATGCLELLFRRRELWRPLSGVQRWQFFASTSYWLVGWTMLVYASLPVLQLLFGLQPVDDQAGEFATHFLPYFLLCVLNLSRFTVRGYTINGLALNWGLAPIHIKSTFTAITGRKIGFTVTSKRALSGVAWGMLAPNLVVIAVLLGACGVGIAGGVDASSVNNVAFALVDALLIGGVIGFGVRQSRGLRATTEPELVAPVEPTVHPTGA